MAVAPSAALQILAPNPVPRPVGAGTAVRAHKPYHHYTCWGLFGSQLLLSMPGEAKTLRQAEKKRDELILKLEREGTAPLAPPDRNRTRLPRPRTVRNTRIPLG